MLPDDQFRLLTAAVDGELTRAEARLLRRLLSSSAEARTVHAELRAARDRLRHLSPAVVPAGLFDRIMARVATAPATTPAPRRAVRRPSPPPWVPVAVAASLLLAVTAGSFWYFTRPARPSHGPAGAEVVRHGASLPARVEGAFRDILPSDAAPPAVPPLAGGYTERAIAPAADAASALAVPEVLPLPRQVFSGNAFPPVRPLPPLELVRIRVPFLASLPEFGRDDTRQRFVEELGREPAYRLDLFARDPSRGAELVQSAARSIGIGVLTDGAAHDRIRRKQGSAYLLYVECLTARELGDLFARLAADDGVSPQPTFDQLHAAPAAAADQKDVREALGVDPGLWKRPQSPARAPAEPKSISAGTAEQLARSLTAPARGLSIKTAILVVSAPASSRTIPSASREIRQFLDTRPERKAAAVPVVIVIRPPAG